MQLSILCILKDNEFYGAVLFSNKLNRKHKEGRGLRPFHSQWDWLLHTQSLVRGTCPWVAGPLHSSHHWAKAGSGAESSLTWKHEYPGKTWANIPAG